MNARRALIGATAVLLCAAALLSQSANPQVITGNARVDRLLSQMTLEEKINLLHGGAEEQPSGVGQAGTWPGLPRLGIPSLRFTDGPPGISVQIWSTGMTSTMGLAATWSREDARNNGVVIAQDAKALGQDVVLQPFVNIVRDFAFGRAHNTFGEDPYLSGQLGAAQIRGSQGEGIMSQVKHFVGYDGANDVIIDPQTLREIYLAPFVHAANAGVSSFMCSYNRINGPYSCGNGEIQNKIFRDEDGFQGFNTSDWGGTHSTLFINEGLDLEMPGGTFFGAVPGQGRGGRGAGTPAGAAAGGRGTQAAGGRGAMAGGGFGGRGGGGMPEERAEGGTAAGGRGMGGGGGRGAGDPAPVGMLEAVKQGLVGEATISRAVGRILVQMDKFGLLDKAPKHNITEVDYASHAPVLRKTAEHAATLLKNEGSVLPLAAADLDSTVFIGPTGGVLVSVGQSGERAMGLPDHNLGPVPALEKIVGKRVNYYPANDFDGAPIPAQAFSSLVRTVTSTGETRNDADVNFTQSNGKALPAGTSCSWSGALHLPSDGVYTIALQTRGATGSLTLDGQQIIAAGSGGRGFGGAPAPGAALPGGAVPGAAMPGPAGGGRSGQGGPPLSSLPGLKGSHPISGNITPTADHLNNSRTKMELKAGTHEITVTIAGEPYGFPVQARLAWVTPEQDRANYEAAVKAAKQAKKAVVFAWGRDRPQVFELTPEQTKLIREVSAANPNTIVVLNTSLPVAMPWINNVKAVLQAWWPGDEGGPAMASVLLGRANPAGRLPITWPVKLSDMVAQDPANHPERTNSGVNGKTTYSEGIYVGYRWYDKQNIEPLFPFGHGLSYSSFEYSGLRLAKTRDGGLDVSFRIRNTSKMAGDEVAQVYLGAPKNPPAGGGAQFAVRSLAQFDRISIGAGESRNVTLHVEPRSMQYWSSAANKWVVPPGARTVYVGSSSRLVRLQTDVEP